MDARPDNPIPAQRDHRPPADRDLRGLLHDVGHGLATVALLVDTIRSDDPPAGGRMLDLLEAETSRLLTAVHDGLRPGRVDEPVAVRVLLEQIAELADRTRPTSVILLPGDEVVLSTDPVVLWRVVINLVGNAMRAAGADGHVRLALSVAGEGAAIEIVDDGPGFLHGESGTAHLGLDVVTRLLAPRYGRLEILDAHPHGTRARVVFTPDRTFRSEGSDSEGADRARPGAL